MTKAQELQWLDTTLAAAPADGYVAETLKHLRQQIEHDIRSDFFTLPDLFAIETETRAAQKVLTDLLTERDVVLEQIRSAKVDLRRVEINRDGALQEAHKLAAKLNSL